MLRRLVLVLLLSSCMASPLAAQETCTCAGTTFEWHGCGSSGTCDPGAWIGCTPSPEDGYTIGAGCHVTVDRDDVLLSQSAPRQVLVRAGGSLVVRGPASLRLGTIGLVSEPGSHVELGGCFRRFAGGEGSACADSLDTDALFPIGRVLPCRDLECEGDAELVRLDWSDTALDLGPRIDDLLARIDVDRDAICFWQRFEDRNVGSDSGYCYRVTAVGVGSGERHLDFDVRQVWHTQSDQAGYPLARREILTGTLAGDAPAGTRTLVFHETSLAVGRAGPVGRFLRCAGDARSYLIATATDEPSGDVLMLADARGLATTYPAGTTCHVDWGWDPWDEAFVMAPVHVSAFEPAPDQTQLRLEGAVSLRGVVADGLGGRTRALSGAGVEVRGGPLLAFEHVWVTDPLVTDTAAVLLDDLECGARVRHLSVTGGPAAPEHDRNYGLAWFGGGECAYTLEHFYTRYTGDDVFVLESSGANPVAAINIRFMQGGPSSLPGDSGQFLDLGRPNPTDVTVRHALCTACTSDDGRGALVGPSAGSGHIRNLLWVGVRNGGVVTNSTESNNWSYAFERFGVIGSMVEPANDQGVGPLAGLVSDRFYVRDVADPRADSSQICRGANYGVQTRGLRRGIFANVALGSVPCEPTLADLSDLYFIDVSRTGPTQGPILQVPPAAASVDLSRLTFAFTRPPTGVTAGIRAPFLQSAPGLRIDGLLLTGFAASGGPSIRAMSLDEPAIAEAVQWGAPSCFSGNDQDENPAVLAAYGVAPLQGVDPQFADPSRRRFDLAIESPLRAVGCGAGEAGYRDVDWAHRKAKLVPMYMAPRPRYCGLGVELPLVLLAIGRRFVSRGSRAA